MPGPPRRPALDQLRPGERDHVDRVVPRPLQQVLDEIEQRLVRPLHVLEREHGRVDVGEPLEEQPPGREQLLPVARLLVAEAEQLREPRLHERTLLRVEKVFLERRLQLGQGGLWIVVLRDQAPHPHHVRQRPVGHALAVGKAAATVPVDDLRDPVEVLVELPHEPGLPDPRDPGHRDQVRLLLLGADVEEILDLAQLAVSSDEGGLEPMGFQGAGTPRDDPQRLPQLRLALLPLELERPGVLVDDRRLGRPARRLADQNTARLRSRLDPRSGVDDIARDHPLADRREVHRRLAGQHARSRPQAFRTHLLAEGRHGSDEIERRTDGALGIVFGRGRRPPHRHHRVPDELLDRAAVQLDQTSAGVEVA